MPTKTCIYCNNEFLVSPRKLSQRFCSNKCANRFNGQHNRNNGWKHALYRLQTFTCQQCGKEFSARSMKSLTRKYCSSQCSGTARGPQQTCLKGPAIPRTCKQCGKEFTTQFTRKRDFCSDKCYRKFSTGENHPRWKGDARVKKDPRDFRWIRLARKIRKRDSYTCQHCGKYQKGRPALHVHHIIPRKLFGSNLQSADSPSNLISLCSSCHTKEENRLRRENKKGRPQGATLETTLEGSAIFTIALNF